MLTAAVYIPNTVEYSDRVKMFNKAAEQVRDRILMSYNNSMLRSADILHDCFGHLLPYILTRGSRSAITSFSSISEYDWSNFVWPMYGPRFIQYRELRPWPARVVTQRVLMHSVDVVTVQAPGLVERLPKQYQSKARVLPNATDFTVDTNHVPFKTVRLLVTRNLSRSNGALELVDLLNISQDKVEVTVLGGLSEQDWDLSHKLSHLPITWHPRIPRDQMSSFWQNTDWLWHVSYLDGMPRSVLEAVAHGVPVLAKRHPGVSFIDNPTDSYITYVDGLTQEDLLQKVVRPPRERALQARLWASTRFSHEEVARQYVRILQELW